ncbi:MraY family glycosyltransferase [Amnibacterium sp. CER49]|uniref:MraY family glycosyltransferase n=1 Tax=Amnibacterium sp. CER49 TaxID=3039161 RepID=UPI0024499200|nr:MraY family glycosyltransferase [Amnibacterium sp. CER49]MDH2445098.1 MraY family glycosyltransferase [Amnibacterium sp. CER49]
MIVTLLVALCAAVVTFLMSIVMWRVGVKYRLYPKIRARDVHTTPTPRLGGIAMYLGVLAGLLLASQIPFFHLVFGDGTQMITIVAAATLIVVIGVLDDFFDLDWSTKLIGQVLAAGLLAWLGGLQIDSLPIGGVTVGSTWSSLALTLFTVVAVMNMMNFIDGLDGLVAGVGVIANGTFYLYSYMLIRLVDQTNYFNLASLISAIAFGACLGFLPLNWHPAKLFMGDAGSLLLGLLMSVSAISVTGSIDPIQLFHNRAQFAPAFLPLLLPFAILIVPLLDFSLAVIRRLAAGKSPFSADRKHLHHRLLDMGHSRFHATLIFYAWTAVISVGSLLFFVARPYWWAWVFIAGGLAVCALATLAPLSHRKRREYEVQREPVSTTTTEIAVLDPLDKAGKQKERHA